MASHRKTLLQIIASVALIVSQPTASHAVSASPGPYEILPFADAYITEAFFDLLMAPNSNRADWTGWFGTSWESPNAYNNHEGTDFAVGTGTPVYAATDGTIVEVVNNIPENTGSNYGNYVIIRADGVSPLGQQLRVITMHLLPANQTVVSPQITVTVGQHVTTGQHIGYSDNTGNSTSEHVHVQSELNSNPNTGICPLYNGHYKYPIMLNPTATKQIGNIVKVKTSSTAIRSDMFDSSPVISVAHPNQYYFASMAKRGYYRIFLPDDASNRSGWIRALDVDDVLTGTVIQALPDAGAYVHNTQLATPYTVRSAPDVSSSILGYLRWGGGRFVADETAPGGWYRVAMPGNFPVWGWVQSDAKMVVYPELVNPNINLANRPPDQFPLFEDFTQTGIASFGRPKFDRSSVKAFSPNAPNGGDGKALFITDAINTGDGAYDSVSVGRQDQADYSVQADVYFNYNPAYGTYERYGIFLRDDGFGGWDQTFEGKGNCYAMTWDSDDGRLRGCKIVNASLTDFATTPIYMPTSGWHTMRIEARGTEIKFFLDNDLKATANDSTFISGLCGMGYSSHLSGYPAARGAYFDNFRAEAMPVSSVADWSVY